MFLKVAAMIGFTCTKLTEFSLLGDGEDAALALVGELPDVAVLLVAELGDGAGRLDQPGAPSAFSWTIFA